jgi:phage-related protein
MEQFKPVVFYLPVRQEIHEWPYEVKKDFGDILTLIQKGSRVGMPSVRPMPAVAEGASEIRARDASGNYRAFFVLHTAQGVVVFHAFTKTTQKTPWKEIAIAKKNDYKGLWKSWRVRDEKKQKRCGGKKSR